MSSHFLTRERAGTLTERSSPACPLGHADERAGTLTSVPGSLVSVLHRDVTHLDDRL